MTYKLGIDLGGTKTETLVLGPDGLPLYRERVATPAHDYAEILEMITTLVRRAESELGHSVSVGIGIPGAISPRSGLLRNSNTVCLNGRPLSRDLESRLEREIRIENDANCFALSEASGGAARDQAVVFGVIIGTGTGGGLVVNGKLLNGPHAITGEWGHNPLPWRRGEDGAPDCYCGKSACIETYLSGPGLAYNYETVFGGTRSSRQIVAGAAAGDASCRAMMAAYHDQMARSLAHLINILDPDVIVLGGGMSNIDSLYEEVPKLLPAYVFSDFVDTPLLRAARGDASGVYGAALLWD
ncbi:MAG: ROK family protein [Gammaproteobacteria bacterium]|nr:ROK family protein [Gammaproteobacteria bacterium]MDH3447570.1 ROK family protein [Gammaproteobacteria bacterium]